MDDYKSKYESLLARTNQLAKAWVQHAEQMEHIRGNLTVEQQAQQTRGYYRGCAVQAAGCAGDLCRLLEQFEDK